MKPVLPVAQARAMRVAPKGPLHMVLGRQFLAKVAVVTGPYGLSVSRGRGRASRRAGVFSEVRRRGTFIGGGGIFELVKAAEINSFLLRRLDVRLPAVPL